jgi:uncharacterized membrane protein YphA (DoxX/SURF4 family)
MSPPSPHAGRALAVLLARLVLGLIFGMAGVYKVFVQGPLVHAAKWFLPYAQSSFLPAWSLWATGVMIPFVELACGAMVFLGVRVRPALVGLGAVLVIVTFGHLLDQPLYAFHEHVIPRLALTLFVLCMGDVDPYSFDAWWAARRARMPAP